MKATKELFFSDEMLKIYGCVNCIWKSFDQCPEGFKPGTGGCTESGYCDKLTGFLGRLAENEDSISAVKEKFHLFIQEVQVLEDRKKFIELQQEMDKARENQEWSKVKELEYKVNAYKLWWARLSESVVKSLSKIADREQKVSDGVAKPLDVQGLNTLLADSAKKLLEEKGK